MIEDNILLLIHAPNGTEELDTARIHELSALYGASECTVSYYEAGRFHEHLYWESKRIGIKEVNDQKYYSLIISIEHHHLHDKVESLHTLVRRNDEVGFFTPFMNLLNPNRRKYPLIRKEIMVCNSINFKLVASLEKVSKHISNKFNDPDDLPFILFNQVKNANLHIIPIYNRNHHSPPVMKSFL